jgi:hypothetical protein
MTTTLSVLSSNAVQLEGSNGGMAFALTVNRSGDTSGSSTDQWAVSSTLAAGNDFIGGVLPSGTVSFAAGDTSNTITVEVNGDSNAGATIFSAYAYGSIVNDDAKWTRLLGSNEEDNATALTTGSDGSIYIVGDTEGNLDGQAYTSDHDAFISKFKPDGSKAWIRLLGSGSFAEATALTTGTDGSIFIGGGTTGSLDG